MAGIQDHEGPKAPGPHSPASAPEAVTMTLSQGTSEATVPATAGALRHEGEPARKSNGEEAVVDPLDVFTSAQDTEDMAVATRSRQSGKQPDWAESHSGNHAVAIVLLLCAVATAYISLTILAEKKLALPNVAFSSEPRQ